jgi:hypothetical protein
VATPLIIQIQNAALDSKSSVTDALRKAKIACAKLALVEFGAWVEYELGGYLDKPVDSLPEYRKLHGTPKAYSPYQGWQPIVFQSAKQREGLGFAPIGMSISAIEAALRGAKASGEFQFPYPAELHTAIMQSLNWGPSNLQIALTVPQVMSIIEAVRNILLTWTIEMEKQGVLGHDLLFTEEEREKSAVATAQTVNNISIGQVGAFVQNAENTLVQGGVDATLNLAGGVRDLLQQVEQFLPAANLPAEVQGETRAALEELRDAANSAKPDSGRLRKGLETLKRVLAPAGEHLLRIAVDAAVTKLIGPA